MLDLNINSWLGGPSLERLRLGWPIGEPLHRKQIEVEEDKVKTEEIMNEQNRGEGGM